ncbi:MAG TPA: OmpA family protein, partial [Flavobacteriaceae bacterium]|nr:OmpA family protein [Flavobacteriaceae bacterium]
LNKKLSEKRAAAVKDYLIAKGLSSVRLSSYGFGEDYPIDTNKTRAGRAKNRRVEIRLVK